VDDIVKAALAKWPYVPHCYGWLALGARGDWYMRDDRCQAAGPFPQVRGSRIDHTKLREFIHRNYAADVHGAWFFQNGPQRVYVQLEAAPFVWRIEDAPGWRVAAHTGAAAQVLGSYLCEQGRLFLQTDIGYGLVHSLDMGLAAAAIDAGVWVPQDMPFEHMPAQFGFQLKPVAQA
jgi:Protein of unknown function (DUF2946)